MAESKAQLAGGGRDEFFLDRLDVYRCALEFAGVSADLSRLLQSRRRHLADHLDRATDSIVLNIAEGVGQLTAGASRRCYRIALGSADVCIGVLDLGRVYGLAPESLLSSGRVLLGRIAAMLVALTR